MMTIFMVLMTNMRITGQQSGLDARVGPLGFSPSDDDRYDDKHGIIIMIMILMMI